MANLAILEPDETEKPLIVDVATMCKTYEFEGTIALLVLLR